MNFEFVKRVANYLREVFGDLTRPVLTIICMKHFCKAKNYNSEIITVSFRTFGRPAEVPGIQALYFGNQFYFHFHARKRIVLPEVYRIHKKM